MWMRYFLGCVVSSYALGASVLPSRQPSLLIPGKIQVAVSLLWMGEHLKAHNLQAVTDFRARFSHVPLVHLLSPAYFLKTSGESAATIPSYIEKQDMIGLHLHPWKSLLREAEVTPIEEPTFWGNEHQASPCAIDCGQDVPLSAYSPQSVSKLMKASIRIFSQNGLKNPSYFMAGSWMSSQSILNLARENGMIYDFSPVSPQQFVGHLKYFPFFAMLETTWPNITSLSQPTNITTPFGSIMQIPNNGSTMDYLSIKQGMAQFKAVAEEYKKNPNHDYFVSIGFCQETAFNQLPRLQNLLTNLFISAKNEGIPIVFYQDPQTTDQELDATQFYQLTHVSKKMNNTRERGSPNNAH